MYTKLLHSMTIFTCNVQFLMKTCDHCSMGMSICVPKLFKSILCLNTIHKSKVLWSPIEPGNMFGAECYILFSLVRGYESVVLCLCSGLGGGPSYSKNINIITSIALYCLVIPNHGCLPPTMDDSPTLVFSRSKQFYFVVICELMFFCIILILPLMLTCINKCFYIDQEHKVCSLWQKRIMN
jgi:hypothetical protein